MPKNTRPNLVLLHGWGMHSGVWQPILERLQPYFHLFFIDLPGFGRNQSQQLPQSLTELGQIIRAQIPDKTYILGWSLGGLAATEIAAQYPETVTGLINVASSPCFIQQDQWPGIQVEVLQRFSSALTTDYAGTINRFLALQVGGSDNYKILLRQLKASLLSAPQPSIENLMQGLNLLATIDLRNSLKQITVPTLFIYGKQDAIVPMKNAEQLTLLNPAINTAIIPGASHTPFLSHSDMFIKNLKEFVHG